MQFCSKIQIKFLEEKMIQTRAKATYGTTVQEIDGSIGSSSSKGPKGPLVSKLPVLDTNHSVS